jgi:hypothetical protein
MALDFGRFLPAGVKLTGLPSVQLTVESGIDPVPQSRIVYGPAVGTAQVQRGGTGIPNTAILFTIGGCLPNVTYLVDAWCSRTDEDTAEVSTRFVCLPIGSP